MNILLALLVSFQLALSGAEARKYPASKPQAYFYVNQALHEYGIHRPVDIWFYPFPGIYAAASGASDCGGSILINSTWLYPERPNYASPSILVVYFHEAGHIYQGFACNGNSAQVETSDSLSTYNTMARLAIKGNEDLALSLAYEMHRMLTVVLVASGGDVSGIHPKTVASIRKWMDTIGESRVKMYYIDPVNYILSGRTEYPTNAWPGGVIHLDSLKQFMRQPSVYLPQVKESCNDRYCN